MNKKVIIAIVVIVIVAVLGVGILHIFNNKASDSPDKTNNNEKLNNDNSANTNKKFLVVYYSATNNTKNVALKIAKNLNGDTFAIVPSNEYTSKDLNWNDKNSRVSKEHNDESLRNVKLTTTKVDNWESYDTILIGYPIWWGIAAWPVNTFVKDNDFNGKTIIPFCTSSSSGLGESGKLLENIANGGNWLEGKRFSQTPSDSDIKQFTNSIK